MPRRPTTRFPSTNLIPDGTMKPFPDPKLSPAEFDAFIRANGLQFKHWRGMFCPNIVDLDTHQHDPQCRQCENGYMFYGGQIVFGILYQNKLERMYEIQGVWENGAAVVTFTSYRDDAEGNAGKGEMNDFMVGDRITCIDYTITWQELIEHSPTGVDRLKYPAVGVEMVRDMDRVYSLGTDFEITDLGLIKWLSTGKQPKANVAAGRGGIFSIVYTANPVFFVEQLLHEIRATKAHDGEGGVVAARLPQQVMIRRDVLFEHPVDKIGKADNDAARSGSLITPA